MSFHCAKGIDDLLLLKFSPIGCDPTLSDDFRNSCEFFIFFIAVFELGPLATSGLSVEIVANDDLLLLLFSFIMVPCSIASTIKPTLRLNLTRIIYFD